MRYTSLSNDITGHLTYISNVSFRINESLIQLNWNEPFMDITYSGNVVDAYLLEINAMTISTMEAMASILLPNVTDITVDLRARNCFGLTPITTFHLMIYQGIVVVLY